MKKWLLTALLCIVPSLAWAACEPTNATPGMIGCWPQVTTMSLTDSVDIWQPLAFPASANRIHLQDFLHVAPPIGDVTPNTGRFSTLTATGAASLNSGGALSGTFTGNPIFNGNPIFSGAVTFTGSAPSGAGITALFGSPPAIGSVAPGSVSSASGALNGTLGATTPNTAAVTSLTQSMSYIQIDPNPFDLASASTQLCTSAQFWCSHATVTSIGTLTGVTDATSFVLADSVLSSGQVQGWDYVLTVAPNGTSASGTRLGMVVLLQQIGTLNGGTITNSGISTAFGASVAMKSNLGGTATLYAGEGNAFVTYCELFATATYTHGCAAYETDIGVAAGGSYDQISHFNLVTSSQHAVEGLTNSNFGIQITAQTGARADIKYGIKFADASSQYAFDPFAHLLSSPVPGSGSLSAASGIDFANMTYKAFSSRQPFSMDVPLQATGITTATRLTSTGAAANSFVYEAVVTGRGTGYTSNPTVAVTGCTSTVINAEPGNGGAFGLSGVYTPGSACAAESTASISGGGGSGATMALQIAGNTVNLPINSTNTIQCSAAAQDASGHSYGFTISFGVTMGATASTTALVGSPTWMQVYPASGTAIALSVAADTTLGAVNITATPTSGTWNIGGKCTVVSTSQVI
jgi:hypothetical protein